MSKLQKPAPMLTNGRGRALPFQTLVKLRPDQVEAAQKASKKNGVDDNFFLSGQDMYVASGTRVPLIAPLKEVRWQGQKAHVISVDNQINTQGDAFKAGLLASIFGTGAVPMAVMLGGLGCLCGWPGFGTLAKLAWGVWKNFHMGIVVGVPLISFAALSLFQLKRKKDTNALARFGEVQKP